jgi:SiaC family regulatory phosphoprotein
MEAFTSDGSEVTPRIVLDQKKGIFEISGRSLPDDCEGTYRPAVNWFKKYTGDSNPATVVEFKLEYMNTASAKMILEILSVLEHIKGIKVVWYFLEDDEDMEETGEEFAELVKMPFELKPY